jgi:hypothetical protein
MAKRLQLSGRSPLVMVTRKPGEAGIVLVDPANRKSTKAVSKENTWPAAQTTRGQTGIAHLVRPELRPHSTQHLSPRAILRVSLD